MLDKFEIKKRMLEAIAENINKYSMEDFVLYKNESEEINKSKLEECTIIIIKFFGSSTAYGQVMIKMSKLTAKKIIKNIAGNDCDPKLEESILQEIGNWIVASFNNRILEINESITQFKVKIEHNTLLLNYNFTNLVEQQSFLLHCDTEVLSVSMIF